MISKETRKQCWNQKTMLNQAFTCVLETTYRSLEHIKMSQRYDLAATKMCTGTLDKTRGTGVSMILTQYFEQGIWRLAPTQMWRTWEPRCTRNDEESRLWKDRDLIWKRKRKPKEVSPFYSFNGQLFTVRPGYIVNKLCSILCLSYNLRSGLEKMTICLFKPGI